MYQIIVYFMKKIIGVLLLIYSVKLIEFLDLGVEPRISRCHLYNKWCIRRVH